MTDRPETRLIHVSDLVVPTSSRATEIAELAGRIDSHPRITTKGRMAVTLLDESVSSVRGGLVVSRLQEGKGPRTLTTEPIHGSLSLSSFIVR